MKPPDTTEAISALSQAGRSDVQRVAVSQVKMLESYYVTVLQQATTSFRWALVAAGVGLLFFLGAVTFLLVELPGQLATVSVVGGALVEVISGINFFLYGRTSAQLAEFHQRLDRTQRFLMADSMCESLAEEEKQRSRAELVRTISTLGEPE